MRSPNLFRSILIIFFLGSVTACGVFTPPAGPSTLPEPETRSASSGPEALLSEMMAQVTPAQLYESIGDLSGQRPVTLGGEPRTLASRVQLNGDAVQIATQYVYEHLRNPGVSVSYFEWELPAGVVTKGRNVVASLPGSTDSDEIVLMTAHVDDMVNRDIDPAGVVKTRPPIPVVDPLWNKYPAPGADDNASGTAGVLLAAHILSGYRFERTVRFVFFNGEEIGYLGSYAYADAMRAAGQNIVAVFNLDMLAFDRAGGPVVDVNMRAPEDSPQDGPLADIFLHIVDIYRINLTPERQYQTGFYVGSDHGMFWTQGYPAVSIMEDSSDDFNPYYHSQYDSLEHLNMTYCANVIQAAIGAVAYIAASWSRHREYSVAARQGIRKSGDLLRSGRWRAGPKAARRRSSSGWGRFRR
jgi:hypothetical protein